MTAKIIGFIYSFVILVIILVWGVVGFIVWVPLLFRMIIYFTSILLYSMFSGSDLSSGEKALSFGVSFYIEGFKRIINIVGIRSNSDPGSPEHNKITIPLLIDLAFNVSFTIGFWFFIYSFFGPSSTWSWLGFGMFFMILSIMLHFFAESKKRFRDRGTHIRANQYK